MRREDLELAILRATEIIRQNEVYIIGSQSILGSFNEEDLPDEVTMSDEVDIVPVFDDDTETAATFSDGQLGERSPFALDPMGVSGDRIEVARTWARHALNSHPPARTRLQ